EIVLKTCLEIALLADFFEERLPNFRIQQWHIARTKKNAAPARLMRGSETRGKESQRAARALEIGDRGPTLAHHVNQGRVKWVCSANAIAEFKSFLFGLSFFRGRLRVRASHLRDNVLICLRGGVGVGGRRHLAQ